MKPSNNAATRNNASGRVSEKSVTDAIWSVYAVVSRSA